MGLTGERVLLTVDAAALSLFAVAGATRALDAGLRVLPALLLGCITAVGGGSLRDVLSGRTPRIFERGELYTIVAVVAAAAFLTCNAAGFSRAIATAVGLGIGFCFRLLALRFGWDGRSSIMTSGVIRARMDIAAVRTVRHIACAVFHCEVKSTHKYISPRKLGDYVGT